MARRTLDKDRIRAALFIDNQNMFPFGYKEMHEAVSDYDVLVKRVYLSRKDITWHQECNRDIVAALQNSGFEVILTGHLDNVDPYILVDATEMVCDERKRIEAILLSSGDTDYLPLIFKARALGKRVVLITKEGQEGVSSALPDAVNEHILLKNAYSCHSEKNSHQNNKRNHR